MTPGAYRMLGVGTAAFALVMIALAIWYIVSTPGAILGSGPPPFETPEADRAEVAFTVAEGASAGEIGRDLEAEGIIRSGRQFQSLVRLMGIGEQISSGSYILETGMSIPSVLNQIALPDSVPIVRVTFPEGIRIEEMARIAEESGLGTASEFFDAVETAEVPPSLDATLPPEDELPEGQQLQGYLFPDTYILPGASDMSDLVDMMLRTMDDRLSPEIRAAGEEHGLNPHEVLTLASIIEREAVVPDERRIMSGVFHNRLEAGEILGADPTTQFAISLDPDNVRLYGYWKDELTAEDLADPSPYNTRANTGLPPGPITNPGLASIRAAANPADTDYFFFVADAVAGDGSHRFAETEGEHQTNIALYGEGGEEAGE